VGDGTTGINVDAQGPGNTVLITLELGKLQVPEPAAGVFEQLVDKAVTQFQQLAWEQQQQQQQHQQAAAAAAVQQAETAAGSSTAQAVVGRSSNSGSSSSRCPNTAKSLASYAWAAVSSSGGGGVNSSNGGWPSSRGNSVAGGGAAGVDSMIDMTKLQPAVPLLPLRYHLEASGPDGECMGGTISHSSVGAMVFTL
jgi:hypothetical protein